MSAEWQIHLSTAMVDDFNIPLSAINYTEKFWHRNFNIKLYHRSSGLNRHLQNIDLTAKYSMFIVFSSAAHGSYFKTDQVLGHKEKS